MSNFPGRSSTRCGGKSSRIFYLMRSTLSPAWCARQNDAAVSMIAGLSDFLRRVLEDSNRQHVRLGEEMEFLQDYLDIQKVRFAERLQVSVDVPNDLFSPRFPV